MFVVVHSITASVSPADIAKSGFTGPRGAVTVAGGGQKFPSVTVSTAVASPTKLVRD